jgi:hypothetical protein
VNLLLAQDSNLAAFQEMGNAERAREVNFIANAVRGFVGYLQESGLKKKEV